MVIKMTTLKEYQDMNDRTKFPRYSLNYPFTFKCNNCSFEITIHTQEDNDPEYYDIVAIDCPKCDHVILASLPVN